MVFRSRRQGLEGPWFGLAAPPTNGFFTTLTSERWRKAAYNRAVNRQARKTSSNLQQKEKNVVAFHLYFVVRVLVTGMYSLAYGARRVCHHLNLQKLSQQQQRLLPVDQY